jgi:hypothetical protein
MARIIFVLHFKAAISVNEQNGEFFARTVFFTPTAGNPGRG